MQESGELEIIYVYVKGRGWEARLASVQDALDKLENDMSQRVFRTLSEPIRFILPGTIRTVTITGTVTI